VGGRAEEVTAITIPASQKRVARPGEGLTRLPVSSPGEGAGLASAINFPNPRFVGCSTTQAITVETVAAPRSIPSLPGNLPSA
jgi:hypothetical protein